MKAITNMTRQLAARAGLIAVILAGAVCAGQKIEGQSAGPTSGPPLHLYRVMDLGALGDGFRESSAETINSQGQIAGYSFDASTSDVLAVFWAHPDSAPVALIVDDTVSNALGIDARGSMIGVVGGVGSSSSHAVVWTNSNSLPQALPGPGDDLGYNGGSINDHGQMVGDAFNDDPNFGEALFWASSDSFPVQLSGLPGLSNTRIPAGRTINNAGQIVGTANNEDDTIQHAVFWADSTSPATDLGGIGELDQSGAAAINNAEQIVGVAYNNNSKIEHGIFWHVGLGPTIKIDLGALDDQFTNTEASAINDQGQIVGNAYTADSSINHAVYWADKNSAALDLNYVIRSGSGWVLQAATDISSSGIIVGYGTIGGHTHAFALVPRTVQEN